MQLDNQIFTKHWLNLYVPASQKKGSCLPSDVEPGRRIGGGVAPSPSSPEAKRGGTPCSLSPRSAGGGEGRARIIAACPFFCSNALVLVAASPSPSSPSSSAAHPLPPKEGTWHRLTHLLCSCCGRIYA